MKYNRLGRTDLSVSAVGLGGWSFGGNLDWGPVDEKAVQSTVLSALESGINLVDTAPIYGESEALLGRVLKGYRQQVILSTKCGLIKRGSWTDHDLRPITIRTQLEESLTRLQTDTLDLYFIHYLDPKIPLETALEELSRQQKAGKIRQIGLCNVTAAEIKRAQQVCPIACVQNEYSFLHPQKGEEVFSICRQENIGFMGYGSLCGGILSGKYKKEPNLRRADARNYFYKCYRGAPFEQAQKKASRVAKLADYLRVKPAQVALAWALANPVVSCALTGARTAEQIYINAAGGNITLSPQDLAWLEERKCTCTQ